MPNVNPQYSLSILPVITSFLFIILLLLVFRELVYWYYKINTVVSKQTIS